MKILLDNCVDWRVERLLTGHEVAHAKDLGWQRLENGKLLETAAHAGFEVVITIDKKMRHEHHLDTLPLAVLVVDSPDSRLAEITRLSPSILAALPDCTTHRFVSVDRDGRVERLAPR